MLGKVGARCGHAQHTDSPGLQESGARDRVGVTLGTLDSFKLMWSPGKGTFGESQEHGPRMRDEVGGGVPGGRGSVAQDSTCAAQTSRKATASARPEPEARGPIRGCCTGAARAVRRRPRS